MYYLLMYPVCHNKSEGIYLFVHSFRGSFVKSEKIGLDFCEILSVRIVAAVRLIAPIRQQAVGMFKFPRSHLERTNSDSYFIPNFLIVLPFIRVYAS